MTATTTVSHPTGLRTDPTVTFRRIASAIALPLAFAAQAVTNTIFAVATSDGLRDDTGAHTMELYGRDAAALEVATVVSLLGSLLVVPGILAALRVLRTSRPRLSLIAGILMIVGYICYFGIAMTGFQTLQLAALAPTEGAAVADAAQGMATAVPFFLLFVLGNLVGTALLGIAVILSRELPWWAGVAILGWPVGHVINLVVGSEWFAVAGGVLEVIGLCALAAAALRTSNTEWVSRG